MSAGRHGKAMRSVIGWWNLTWMSSNALGLAAMAFFMMTDGEGRALVGRRAGTDLPAGNDHGVLVAHVSRGPRQRDTGHPVACRYRPDAAVQVASCCR